MFILNADEPEKLAAYLRQKQWLQENESIVSVSIPGQGNMNYVLRVETQQRSFIVKQSRGYVEKYPQLPAPKERALIEAAFYTKIVKSTAVQKLMPALLGIDSTNNLLVLEDLGNSNDYSSLYQLNQKIQEEELAQLVNYLNSLHAVFQKTVVDDELANHAMKALNHEHIFDYPFKIENGFDLDSIQVGLQELALIYKKQPVLKYKVERLGSLYLSKGKYLVHGDFYPGSWLRTTNDIKIIDPEFCFYGLREFDLAVLIAHLYLTKQDATTIAFVKKNYYAFDELNTTILNGFIGTEIIRRLIGLAQLPLEMDMKTKKELLVFAQDLILK